MRRKRYILTNAIYKWKSRLNLHDGQQEYAVNFYETYSPVISWASARLLLIHAIIYKWHTRQVDFTLAFPHTDIEFPMYMQLPVGINLKEGNRKTHVLKLKKKLYGQKQGSRIWFLHLTKILKQLKYRQSSFDECIFTKGNLILFFYADDSVFLCPDKSKVDDTIQELRDAKLEMEDQGDLTDYLDINFTYQKDGSIIMSQPQLIDQIIQDVKLMSNYHLLSTPAAASKLLQRDQKAKPFNGRFHYRSVIGKLNYLDKGTRPDITYATHQCARFCEDPKEVHGKVVEYILGYSKKN